MATSNYNVDIASGVILHAFVASGDLSALLGSADEICVRCPASASGALLVNVRGLHLRDDNTSLDGVPIDWFRIPVGSEKIFRLQENGISSVKVTPEPTGLFMTSVDWGLVGRQ